MMYYLSYSMQQQSRFTIFSTGEISNLCSTYRGKVFEVGLLRGNTVSSIMKIRWVLSDIEVNKDISV
jgi:hypothetical protein